METLFGDDTVPPERSGPAGGRARPPAGESVADAPLATRMRPATLEEFVGQRDLLAEGSALRTRDRVRASALDDPARAAGERQDDAGTDRRGGLRGCVRGGERRAGRAGRGQGGDRAGAPASPALRHRDDLLPRRDPSLQQGPAGRAAASGRGGLDHSDRGDDREPVLRGQHRTAFAQPRLRVAGAVGRGRAGPARPRGRAGRGRGSGADRRRRARIRGRLDAGRREGRAERARAGGGRPPGRTGA